MPDLIETTLATALSDKTTIGQILIQRTDGNGFALCHRGDENRGGLEILRKPEDAIEIGRYDSAGNFRALKTAPNLRRGWRLEVATLDELRRALDHFYPGRLAVLLAFQQERLVTTPLRETLNRQSGMYKVAAKISDEQIAELVGDFCKSNGGCLRTILWKRDTSGAVPSAKLPPEKFDPHYNESGGDKQTVPLLCQEACNLLVAECRNVVKGGTNQQ